MRLPYFFFVFVPLAAKSQTAAPPIGSWREHLPYHRTIALAAADQKIFAATPYSLFSVHSTTGEVQRHSRLTGLSETGIADIAFDAGRKKLVVGYRNSNIDILAENSITGVPGLKRVNIPGDKTIYDIYPTSGFCYLATGIGIVELDLDRAEMRDSWFIGAGGSREKVFSVTKDDRNFFAATASGLKVAPLTAVLADWRNWATVPGMEQTTALQHWQGQVVALQRDSVFLHTISGWQFFYADGWKIESIQVSEKLLALSQTGSGTGRIVFLNASGTVQQLLQQPSFIAHPTHALKKGSDYWISDAVHGLSRWTPGNFISYQLNSPKDIATGELRIRNNVLVAAAGGVDAAWTGSGRGNGYYRLAENEWTNFHRDQQPLFDSLPDIITVAIDPRDGTTWAGSFGGGLLHHTASGTFVNYKQASPLRPPASDPGSYRVSGLAFDLANNLWVANYGSPEILHVRKQDGGWQSFSPPFSLAENAVGGILVDDLDQKWIISPKGNGLLVFNHGNTLENIADDQWKRYMSGANAGNLPSSHVLSLAQDQEGSVWVGTDDGIAIIPCPWEVFKSGCPAILPVVKEGGFSNYLFKGERINAIAVDGGDRKWIGTSNGAWLVTHTGEKVLAHFTEENSPLLSNEIQRIAVNGTTGEVFFATAKGICAFRGAATDAAENNDALLVYPNPVPPGYGGSIAIKGLAANSFVKITELNGRLVFQAKALGGQAVWNGRDYTGKKIASGVYLVIVTDENKNERRAGRIVFIRG